MSITSTASSRINDVTNCKLFRECQIATIYILSRAHQCSKADVDQMESQGQSANVFSTSMTLFPPDVCPECGSDESASSSSKLTWSCPTGGHSGRWSRRNDKI